MANNRKIPHLVQFLYGESAETVPLEPGSRLWRWAQAFEEWLAEQSYPGTGTYKNLLYTWKQLLNERKKPPWEMDQADIEAYQAWMHAEGKAARTIVIRIGILAKFYTWCNQRQVDPECEPGFNPAVAVKRPPLRAYRGPDGKQAVMLSRGEIARLQIVTEQDKTPLAMRDHAFLTARLGLGVPLKSLQRLEWGQIEVVGEGEASEAWVAWRPEIGRWRKEADCARADPRRCRLPDAVWQAIRAYLEAAGRLEGMQPGKYIFAPLAVSNHEGAGRRAQDWREDQFLLNGQMNVVLKIYGAAAGIPEQKLNYRVFKRSAIRLWLGEKGHETQYSEAEFKAFLNSVGHLREISYRMRRLPDLEADEGQPVDKKELIAPDRRQMAYKPSGGIKHGMYKQNKPPEVVQAVLAENIHGLEEEIQKLQELENGMLRLLEQGPEKALAVQLLTTQSLVSQRLAEMLQAQEELSQPEEVSKEETDAKAALERLASLARELGLIPDGYPDDEAVVEEVVEAAGAAGLSLESLSQAIAREVAATRYSLRNAYDLANQTDDPYEYLTMVRVYETNSGRLVKMLKKQPSNEGQYQAFLRSTVQQALWDVTGELGLRDG